MIVHSKEQSRHIPPGTWRLLAKSPPTKTTNGARRNAGAFCVHPTFPLLAEAVGRTWTGISS